MKHHRRRKCKHCGKLYRVNSRCYIRQSYCCEADCQKASHRASQRRYLANPKNNDPHRATDAVVRVQAWRKANPGYWRRGTPRPVALHDELSSQPIDIKEDTISLIRGALHDESLSQDPLLVGIISSLTGTALHDEIAESMRLFQTRGEIILGIVPGMKNPRGEKNGREARVVSGTGEAGP